MRKWFLILIMVMVLAFPSLAFAQTSVALANVTVQLWPEYDQPSMLVLVDYEVAANTQLPINVTFRIPKDANLVAVATYSTEGTLVNAGFDGPKAEGEWQSFTTTIGTNKGRLEYYQPIAFNGEQRVFSYVWDGIYAVDSFNISVLEPLDTKSLVMTPKSDSISQDQGLKYYNKKPVKLAANEKFTLNLQYEKTSDALISSSQAVQPAAPLDDNTTGRVSFSNSLPYIIGGVGLLLIIGGVIYYLQAGKTGKKKFRRRAGGKSDEEEGNDSDVYCSQCGTRARTGDRFCRICGSRIKQQDG